MKRIENYEQLQKERQQVREKISQLELLIAEDIEEIKGMLNPLTTVGGIVKSMVTSDKDGVIGESISLTVDALIKKLLLRKSNWMFKLAIAFLVKNYAKNLVSKNSESILEWFKDKLRKRRNNNSEERFHESSVNGELED